MGQYWTRKNDQEDLDAEKTANPWAEHKVKADRNIPDKEPTEYDKYCQMMAQQQEDEMDETIMEDELKEYQPEGVFVRGH